MKLVHRMMLAVVMIASAGFIEGCPGSTPAQNAQVTQAVVLTADQLECVLESIETQIPALATACKIDQTLVPALTPVLTDIIFGRDAGRAQKAAQKH